MNPYPRLILTVLVLLGIPQVCFSQDDQQLYETCQQPFRCGDLPELTYPFWGGDRPSSCGHPGFGLKCEDSVPLVNISSVSYRVLRVDNSTRTLKVSRDDLWENLCLESVINTSLTPTLFNFYPMYNDQSIALYYNRSFNNPLPPPSLPNQFNCTSSFSFLQHPITNMWRLGNGITCTEHIYVPVNETAAAELTRFLPSWMTILRDALRSGFWIQWTADEDKCNNCMQSGGLCGQNPVSEMFACHCIDKTYDSTCNAGQNANGSGKGLSATQKYVIIGTSLGGIGVLLLGIFIFYTRKQCRSLPKMYKKNSHLYNMEKFLVNNGRSQAPTRYGYNEIKRITKSFSYKLGQGGYGIVYKGWLADGQIVAVKVLTETDNIGEEFINEVASISKTSHVNIVNLLGFCHDKKRRALVYDFMPNKSLDKFIYKEGQHNPERLLDWNKLHDIATGVARGLEYLHRDCNTRIIHFDIKPHNILLDKDFCPKISDFGLAKLFKKDRSIISVLGTRGTVGYIAPEVFSRNFGAVSHKSDVYSFGMVLLEMAGSRKLDEIETAQSSGDYFFDKIYELAVVNTNKLGSLIIAEENTNKLESLIIAEENKEIARKMLLVGLWCVQTAPSDRPSMTKVVEMLQGRFESIGTPPKPFFSPLELSAPQISSTFSLDVVTENETEERIVHPWNE